MNFKNFYDFFFSISQTTEQDLFKVPQLPTSTSNIRPQQLVKRKGLVRPSSGFYSTSLKKNDTSTNECDRLSPTNVSF